MRLAVGVDLGGTKVAFGVVAENGEVILWSERATPRQAPPEDTLALIAEEVRSLVSQAPGPVVGVGLGIPGLMDREAGISLFSPNLPTWRNVPVVPTLTRSLDLPVAMDNDVRVATLGELYFGAGAGTRTFICVTWGTGVGSGMVLEGKLWRGEGNRAGEIGHLPLEPEGPVCGCGNRGCLEALCAGPAMARDAREAIRMGLATSLASLPLEAITARDVVAAAREGDRTAEAIVHRAAKTLGRGLAAYATLISPQRIAIGGGLSETLPFTMPSVLEGFRLHAMPVTREAVEVVPAALGPRAGVVGAASMMLRGH